MGWDSKERGGGVRWEVVGGGGADKGRLCAVGRLRSEDDERDHLVICPLLANDESPSRTVTLQQQRAPIIHPD